jgi:hypothetical protein
MFEVFHKQLLHRWWRRLLSGQPSLALEVHCSDWSPTFGAGDTPLRSVWLALCCPADLELALEAALRTAYPNCRLESSVATLGVPPTVLRLKKHSTFIKRVKMLDRFDHEREPRIDRLLTVMGACGEPALVQIAMTPTPALFEWYARWLYKRHETHLAHARREGLRPTLDRSMVDETELRGGLEVQHRPLFFIDVRIVASGRRACESIASELRAEGAENRLVERGTPVRQGALGLYTRRIHRGEGNPLPSPRRGVFASTELAAIWHLPSVDYVAVPFARGSVPLAPAPPAIMRPPNEEGTLRDALGPVSLQLEMRRQNTAVPGAVEQGKSSYLVATVAEDLRRDQCAVIVLDPKGDAAEAAVSLVAPERTCTLLDFSHPTCGFNPLAVAAPADVIADYVVAALKNLFTDADIRASSDRYLRNAIIAVLAHDRGSTLWDAARLLSVGEEGYAYRTRVGTHVRTMPEFKEISEFFTAELVAQLADARSMTTAKLDAPVNKLARLLNSASIKRVLLNDSLVIDLDRIISQREVLVVKGALGAMGAGNTSVLMQLLVGMLDAALARQQDHVRPDQRVAVALKVDEAPLVLNRGFAETMALKRSAGLETVACWQTEAQWTDRDVREQLDALFAHRVYFATASVDDARSAAGLMMAEYSDMVRRDAGAIPALSQPDARLHLPRHHAIVSWSTPAGRQAPFLARTIPLRVNRERVTLHAALQAGRGGRYRSDLRQPHWDRPRSTEESEKDKSAAPVDLGPRQQIGVGRQHVASESHEPPARAPVDSYRELVDIDQANLVRWVRRVDPLSVLEPDPLDLEILTLVAALRHVLTSQIHRRFNRDRATTTTQRRLKRLADAGLVARFQFHRRDGGGAPMCYVLAPAGYEYLRARDRPGIQEGEDFQPDRGLSPSISEGDPRQSSRSRRPDGRQLHQARHDVHVAGWALALEETLRAAPLRLRGPEDSLLSPPTRTNSQGRVAIGPSDLRLPGGRTAHEFLRSQNDGERIEVERFETVRPDATVELPRTLIEQRVAALVSQGVEMQLGCAGVDVLVERDDRLAVGLGVTKLERYDHLLAGWSTSTKRYGRLAKARPLVVFICRDRRRARECARRSDRLLSACRAYAGEYPVDWKYPGREGIMFVCERDVHEGNLLAYRVPGLPPDLRQAASQGDPRAREPIAETTQILA